MLGLYGKESSYLINDTSYVSYGCKSRQNMSQRFSFILTLNKDNYNESIQIETVTKPL